MLVTWLIGWIIVKVGLNSTDCSFILVFSRICTYYKLYKNYFFKKVYTVYLWISNWLSNRSTGHSKLHLDYSLIRRYLIMREHHQEKHFFKCYLPILVEGHLYLWFCYLQSAKVKEILKEQEQSGRIIGAICAGNLML